MASQPISCSNRKRNEQTETEHVHSWHTNGFEYIYIKDVPAWCYHRGTPMPQEGIP